MNDTPPFAILYQRCPIYHVAGQGLLEVITEFTCTPLSHDRLDPGLMVWKKSVGTNAGRRIVKSRVHTHNRNRIRSIGQVLQPDGADRTGHIITHGQQTIKLEDIPCIQLRSGNIACSSNGRVFVQQSIGISILENLNIGIGSQTAGSRPK